jgi:hypothetical protein
MQLTKIFRIALVVGAVAYAAYWFLPYSYGYLDSATGSLLSYSGYGAIYSGNEFIDVAIFVVWLISAFGMFFYRKVARSIFLFLVVANTVAVPLYGLSVETAGGAMMLDVAHIADGMVLALAYFSPVKDEFY